jgi:hypothetical protein
MNDLKPGDTVIFIDAHGSEFRALVTKVWQPNGHTAAPWVNLEYESHAGPKNETSVCHESVSLNMVRYWRGLAS